MLIEKLNHDQLKKVELENLKNRLNNAPLSEREAIKEIIKQKEKQYAEDYGSKISSSICSINSSSFNSLDGGEAAARRQAEETRERKTEQQQKINQAIINSKYKYVPVQFSGKTYKILTEIPDDLDIIKGTKTIKSKNDVIFDLGVFISGFSFNDEKPDPIGREYPIVAPNVSLNSKIGIFTGCIDNFNKSVNSSYLHMRKVKSSEDLYIILAGTNTTYSTYDHIGYIGKSWYFSQDDAWGKYCVSDICEKLYEDSSGNKAKKTDKYDINLKLDKKHKGEIYSSIIYIDESGEIMEKAIIYPKDKVVLGKRKGFLDLGFEPIEDITDKFTDPRPASKKIYQLYNDMKGK